MASTRMASTTAPADRADEPEREVVVHRRPPEETPWEPRVLAGDADDDGSEPHIYRGID